ncbi:MAG TPA: WG repeat-containing protein [Prosthecobacter sp.]
MTSRNLFRISTGRHFGLINDQGDIVLKPTFAGLGDVRSEGIVATKDGIRYGVIDDSGRFIVEPVFESLGASFSCDLLAAKKDRFGYISPDGRTVIDFQFRSASHFFEDRAAVDTVDGYCFISKSGSPLTADRYARVRFFSCSRGGVIIDHQLGFIDPNGTLVVKPKFDALLSSNFHNNYSAVVHNDRWGMIDLAGEYAIPPEFGFVGNVSQEGIAAIQRTDGKWKHVNVRNSVQSEQLYDFAGEFSSGRAIVKLGQRCYLTDEFFQILKPLDYDRGLHVAPGYIIVEVQEREGVIDCEGNVLIPCRYDQVQWSGGEIFEFSLGDCWGYVNSRGREIWRSRGN